jgi:hypothetical protein
MRKTVAIMALAILTACGGGSDTTQLPLPPGVPANVYNAMDGTWKCVNDSKPAESFVMSAAFSGTQAAWSGYWPATKHEAYVVYNDIVGNSGITLFYSEARVDTPNFYNTISFVSPTRGTPVGAGQGPINFSIAEGPDWSLPFTDKIWVCTR